jgi:hypothetical protein
MLPLALDLDEHPLAVVRYAASQAETSCQGVYEGTKAYYLDDAFNPNPEPRSHGTSRSCLD